MYLWLRRSEVCKCDCYSTQQNVCKLWKCPQYLRVVVVVQSLSRVWLFATPWTAARQASLSFAFSWSLLKLMSIEAVMPSKFLILCRPLLLLSSIFPSIRVFSNELALRIRWPKCWSFSFSISPSNEYSGLILADPILQTDQLRHRVETLLRSYSYSVWEPGPKLRQSGFILQSCLWGQLEH